MNAPSTCLDPPPPAAVAERVEALAARLSPATRLLPDAPLAPRTTLRVGGRADLLIEPADETDLAETLRFCHENGIPWRVLGRGSNLLVREGGVREWVIALNGPAFQGIELRDSRLRCGAGVLLKTLAATALQQGLTGLEFLEGIPGTVGGALRMNAGAHQAWTFQAVERVWGLDAAGQPGEWTPEELPVSYRACSFFESHLATAALFRGHPADPESIRERMEAFRRKRHASQPRQSSGGCVFKNPTAAPAGKLIEDLGLKGLRVGDAMVSPVHGNFIVNLGQATATEVLALIGQVRDRVRAGAGVELETEIEIWGADAERSNAPETP